MTRSPWRFQGYEQQQLTGFTLLPRSSHPTDATPTMESCSRSSRRDKLVLWSQEYFRLMESWRFLKNDSRSRASLKNCRDKREGYLVLSASWHQDGERTTPLCRLIRQSWITKATPGKQQGCLPQSPLNTIQELVCFTLQKPLLFLLVCRLVTALDCQVYFMKSLEVEGSRVSIYWYDYKMIRKLI